MKGDTRPAIPYGHIQVPAVGFFASFCPAAPELDHCQAGGPFARWVGCTLEMEPQVPLALCALTELVLY
jgi:hypothetical protein